MTIRFLCGSCTQPIEVDDEWASKQVACPYCRRTITAPAESTLTDFHDVPTANPLARAGGPAVTSVTIAEPSSNKVAVAAGILCTCLVACILVLSVIQYVHRAELAELGDTATKALQEDGVMAMLKAQNEFYETRGGIPKWVLAIAGLQGLGAFLWIATLVCALIALRRRYRRGLALGSLIVALLTPVVFCCGAGI